VATEFIIKFEKDFNPKIIDIKDYTLYGDCDGPENLLLEILAPTKNKWITYPIVANKGFIVNSVNLKLSSTLQNLPDGIYEVKISHKPNFATQSLYYYFHVKNLRVDYYDKLTELYDERCEITKREFEENRQKLLMIDMDFLALEYMTEINHEKEKAKELYDKIKEDLKKYGNECGCNQVKIR
jgi:GH15 family glucan-1,4-alpha-glucosidase